MKFGLSVVVPKWVDQKNNGNTEIVEFEVPEYTIRIIAKFKAQLVKQKLMKNHFVAFDYRLLLDAQPDRLPDGYDLNEIALKIRKLGLSKKEVSQKLRNDCLQLEALRQNLNRKLFRILDCDVALTEFGIASFGE